MCARYRAAVDIRVAQLLSATGLFKPGVEGEDLFMPETGGRFLASTESLRPQVIHCDRPAMGYVGVMEGERNPGYFTICSGPRELKLWVVEGSHRAIAITRPNYVRALGMSSNAIRVTIPPFSVFFGRGDLMNADCGWDDGAEHGPNVRYHIYFTPGNSPVTDSINIMEGYRPYLMREPGNELKDDSVVEESSSNLKRKRRAMRRKTRMKGRKNH